MIIALNHVVLIIFNLQDFQPFLFGTKITINDYISNSLCLQISIAELLEAIEGRSVSTTS